MRQISFVINTANNEFNHIKLLLNSLKLNLDGNKHEILVFIDNDNQGTYKYLKSIKNDFFDLKIITHKLFPCVGYSRNNNLLVELAKHDIVSYLQSDMVISPHYDTDVLNQLEPNTILSATRVEPPLHGESNRTITKNFGIYPKDFNLEEWNKYSLTVKQNKDTNYFFAPITFYKSVWLDIGGYDTLFRRSREDSDLVQRCIHAGIKLKQTFNAIVYHFTCTSSRGADWFNKQNIEAQNRAKLQEYADQIELKRFIRKWGNFNHGEIKLVKYDIDLIIKNSNKLDLNFLLNLEPLFSYMWLDSNIKQESLLNQLSNEHKPANKLLNFTDKQWHETSKYHNLDNYGSRILVLEEDIVMDNLLQERCNIIIDGDLIQDSDTELFKNLHVIINEYKEGNYEFGSIKINLKNKTPLDNTVVINPPFNMDLLKIE